MHKRVNLYSIIKDDLKNHNKCVPHSNPKKCKQRIVELLRALTTKGYGLHLFEPAWFDKDHNEQRFKSPTVVPLPDKDTYVHSIKDACADDALWLIGAIVNYIKETGEVKFIDEIISYADGGEGTVYEHMCRILDFSNQEVGTNGICKGLRADWNDCLNLGGGESAMVSFLLHWAFVQFIELADFVGRGEDARYYKSLGIPLDRSWLMGTYMYNQAFLRGDVDYSSAIAVVIVVLGVVFAKIAKTLFKQKDY